MASNTTTVVVLMLVGMGTFFIGWPWWMGIGIIAMAAVLAMSGSGEEPVMQRVPAMPVSMPKPASAQPAAKPSAKPDEGFDIDDMKWSPTTFADGMPGNKMDGDFGGAVGSRSSAFTQDMDIIRFKDDVRIRISDGDFYKMCTDPYTGKALTAWDFRTRKDVFPGLHSGNVKTVESPDDMTNPGVGSPNDWAKAERLRRQQQQ